MVRIQSPHADPLRYREYQRLDKYSKPFDPSSKSRILKSKPTFDCYSNQTGPDIKLNNLGPEYKGTKYQYREYKPKTMTSYKSRPISPKDPLKSKPVYIDKPVGMYKRDVNYKLNKDNFAGLRHWNYGFVEDTVAAKGSTTRSKNKYSVQEKPKPVKTRPEQRPVVPAVVPVKRTPPPPSPPLKKSYKTSSTQHIGPGLKTTTTQTQVSKTKSVGTQYEPAKMKTVSVQAESSTSPLPVVAPLPITQSVKKVPTKSKGVQCSESPKKTEVYRRHSPSPEVVPIIATVPVRRSPTKQRIPTPKRVTPEKTYQPPIETRWTPSPEVVERAPVYASTKTSKVFISPNEPKPEVASYPDYSAASQNSYKSGRDMFPYQTAQSRLPPEITACIEAYDIAHGPV
ncbi:proteoglycan 4-like [Mercenaria mercenaria]|uniref:proteoglycan 4-like n=1 Tax=Mercenaria mercenaria TaxID=6596 RepID=UPI00234E985F|nr:proteoglycan 4-like [Mercenaria mercenaria]